MSSHEEKKGGLRMRRLSSGAMAILLAAMAVPGQAGKFAWVGSANTGTVKLSHLSTAVANGITHDCSESYPHRRFVFYVAGADYFNPRDGTYVYTATVTLFRRDSKWADTAPIESYSLTGYRRGAPALPVRQQLLLGATRDSTFEVCRRAMARR
jgi:hypothetical protein